MSEINIDGAAPHTATGANKKEPLGEKKDQSFKVLILQNS